MFQNVLFEENFLQWLFQNFTSVSDRFLGGIPKLERKSSYFLYRVKLPSDFCASETASKLRGLAEKTDTRVKSCKSDFDCNKMDNIPLISEFDVETYIPVINATNRYPIEASKEHILLFNKIRKYNIISTYCIIYV